MLLQLSSYVRKLYDKCKFIYIMCNIVLFISITFVAIIYNLQFRLHIYFNNKINQYIKNPDILKIEHKTTNIHILFGISIFYCKDIAKKTK